MKSDGTIVLGYDDNGKIVFAKTFDFDEVSKVERDAAFEAFEFVRSNCARWSMGDTLHCINFLIDEPKDLNNGKD